MNAEPETLASNKEAIDTKINRIIFIARLIKRRVKSNQDSGNFAMQQGLLDEVHELDKLLNRNSYLLLIKEQ